MTQTASPTNWKSTTAATLLLLVGLIPFNFLPAFPIGSFSLPFHFLIFLPVGLFLLAWSCLEFWRRRSFPGFAIVTLVLVATLTISCAVAASKKEAFSTVAGFVLRALALGWFTYHIGSNQIDRNAFVRLLPLVGVLISAAAMSEPLSGHFFLIERTISSGLSSGELWGPSYGVASGPIGQPLPLSACLNMIFPFALWDWSQRKTWSTLAGTLVIAGGILMAGRRSGYLVMVLSAVVILSMSRRSSIFWLALCLVGAIGVIFVNPRTRLEVAARFHPAVTIRDFKEGHRSRVYRTVADIVRQRPWLGIGTRQYEKSFRTFATYPDAVNTPDSQYLRLLAENGIVGFLAFCGFIVYTVRRLWSGRKNDGAVFLVSVAGFLLTLLVLDGLYWPATAMTFMAVAGAGVGRADVRGNEQ